MVFFSSCLFTLPDSTSVFCFGLHLIFGVIPCHNDGLHAYVLFAVVLSFVPIIEFPSLKLLRQL
ncbi:hypothetical protein ARMGADRAFT_108502 [Armillaria gallica]|uniref:Uncharacterized protein n=1 Tax=Armillaria gallica TaxID=47427 RepID=A0A2H3DF74_ARMGA|nr:hypothetical protein ARMGADRAFT_108502 [Armillaria gallica]